MLRWRPYGHPDTLSPDPEQGIEAGALWQEMHGAGKWVPWSNKPWQYDHLQSPKRQKAAIAGNRLGKSDVGAVEVAYHATGMYPDWYTGPRHTGNLLIWCSTVTTEVSRDVQQQKLLGSSNKAATNFGTGLIPGDLIIPESIKYRVAGVSDVIDMIRIRRECGGFAEVQFKSFDQGHRKFGGRDVHHHWMDEPPDENNSKEAQIFGESQLRRAACDGTITVTMTPTLGASKMYEHFTTYDGANLVLATFDDAPHLSPAIKQEMWDSIPPHERECRLYGIPMMGGGKVLRAPESEYVVTDFQIPDHWYRIAGVDFGAFHPTGLAWLAEDRDTSTLYCYAARRSDSKHTAEIAWLFKQRGDWIPIAWPHDGGRHHGPREGKTWCEAYRDHGLKMLTHSARYKSTDNGPMPVERVVQDFCERIYDGRFKIFASCRDLIDELRLWHRDDNGKIVDKKDDVIKAMLYAMVMRRYGAVQNMRKFSASPYTSAII